MTNDTTKNNPFYQARQRAARWDDCFDDRVSTQYATGICESRLYKIESGIYIPHRDELIVMAEKYRAPELICYYCGKLCPVSAWMKEHEG